jgi:L-aspartate oxidase
MPAIHPMAELAPRDVVAHAIVRQMAATGSDHVLLDARGLAAEHGRGFLARRFPTITARLRDAGIDWTEEPVPVAPAQHYHSGGVVTDLDGRSDVPGLYAVGEVACTGVHGANRLASNSLLEGLVFAHRAARDIAARLAAGDLVRHDPVERAGAPGLVPAAARSRVQSIATAGPGVIRDERGLLGARTHLAAVLDAADEGDVVAEPQLAEWETTNVHQVASALTEAALRRTESRGGHFRSDFPAVDPTWERRVVVRLGADGELVVT